MDMPHFDAQYKIKKGTDGSLFPSCYAKKATTYRFEN
jgi:hypothetical protein